MTTTALVALDTVPGFEFATRVQNVTGTPTVSGPTVI